MVWFRRHPATLEVEEEVPARGRPTDAPCLVPGCTGRDRVLCDYCDRRGVPCATAWCSEHIVTWGSWHLCRRHASLCRALAPAEFRGQIPAPDLDSRSASLAAHLGDDLDRRVRQLLGEVMRAAEGETVSAEPLTMAVIRPSSRRWIRSWNLFDVNGPLIRIAVEVDEATDPECSIRLNGRVILRCVPSWIAVRSSGPAAAQETGELRESFASAVVDRHLRPAVTDEDHWVRRWEHPMRTAGIAG